MKKENKTDKTKQLHEGSIIFTIMNIAAGLFIFSLGTFFLSNKFYIEGISFVLLAAFAFLPRKIVKISSGKKFIIVIIASIIFMVGSILLSGPVPENFINHNLQEEFIINLGAANITMIIYNATESAVIDGKTTNGYFINLNCKIINLDDSPVIINEKWESELRDNQNNSFQGKFSGIQQMFQPGVEKECYFLFEVPKTAQELKLYIEDWDVTHVINLEK